MTIYSAMYLTEFLTVALIHLLAVASPGPDFAIVTKNSLTHTRKIGILTAIGVGLAIGLHVLYSLVGISFLISKSILLFNVIKYVGALYLIYIGIVALRSKPKGEVAHGSRVYDIKKETISYKKAFAMGFLTNALNPKATLFFLSVFTQVINPHTPKLIQGLYGLEMIIATTLWFSLVAIFFSNAFLKQRITRYKHWIDRVFGGVLVTLGIRVALGDHE